MLGVLAAGRGCVPLDPGNPDERNQLIARQSGAAAAISSNELAGRARTLFSYDFPLVNVDKLDSAPAAKPSAQPTANDLAVIVYTSGSTGRPKGVYHSHRNILHDVMQQTNTLHANPDDRIALVYSPTVIGAVREMLITLLNGGSLHILPPNELQPAGLAREIRERGITILRLVPALLHRLVEVLGPDERLDSVRVLGVTSQRVDWSDFDLFRRHFSPEAFLITGYGSTECGGNVAHWFVDPRLRATSPRLPIGRMLPDVRLTIADENGRPVPDGQVGEIVVSGQYLGLGYWREPELTARAFLADPADPASRMLWTGDLGRLRPDGLLEHAGRNDQQIKLRGHRIELAEVESTLAGCPGVEDAAVVVRKDEVGLARSLAAYVEPGRGAPELHSRDLISALTKRLPRYMVPGSIHVLDRLPRLPNLKIDRVRLAEIDAMRMASSGNPVDDPMLVDLIGIFETVLNISGATPEDNTSSLGGDSLQAVRIAIEIETRYGVPIPPGVFESLSTIRELAGWIASQQRPNRSDAITASGSCPMTLINDPIPVNRARAVGSRAELVFELSLASRSGNRPRLEVATPYQWTNACHDIWEAGDIDVMEYAVRLFHGEYPEIEYFQSLARLFDGLPRQGPAAVEFFDDPAADVQIVRRSGCEKVLIVFCACEGTLGLPTNFVHQWLGRLPVSLVYLKDFRNLSMGCGLPSLGHDPASMTAALRRIVEEIEGRQIYTLGVSLGGFAAMHYGLQLGAQAVLNLAGPTSFKKDFLDTLGPIPEEYHQIRELAPGYSVSLRELYAAAARRPHVTLVYSAGHPRDRQQAQQMSGLSGVDLLAVDYAQHNVIDPLICNGELLALLQRFVLKRAVAANSKLSALFVSCVQRLSRG